MTSAKESGKSHAGQLPLVGLQIGRSTADDDLPPLPPSISTIFPTEIQKMILRHLNWKALLHLRATNRRYFNIVTNDCQEIWKVHHDARWNNGKRRHTMCRTRIEAWSRLRGWMTHPVEMEDDNWHAEFLRRSRLDQTVLLRVMELGVEQSQSNDAWYYLMREGADIIDRLKSIILEHRNMPHSTLDVVGEKVLNGISRCIAYQEWRFLHDATVLPQTTIENGAISIAKFYDKHDSIMRNDCIHSWETIALEELEKNADIVKKRLDKRACALIDSKYPILEVIEEMKYLFRVPTPSDDDPTVPSFRGNAGDYYNHTNSLINHCLIEKTGIPITLAVIYAAIVRRVCYVEMDIIGLPGHIVVGVPANGMDNRSRKFVDPFNEAKILSYADCQNIVTRYNMTFNDDMIRPISNDQVWQRMLRNLIHSHSMQALADDNDDDSESSHEWKIAIPLRFLLSDYANRITSFGDLVAAPGWCPQFC